MLESHPNLVYWAALVFAYSPWLGETLINNQDLLPGLLPTQSLDRSRSAEELQQSFGEMCSQFPQSDTAALLARFKRRQYVRILLRDLLGLATLAETTGEISTLADVLIDEAVRQVTLQLEQRYGSAKPLDNVAGPTKPRFTVLSLGKLGGNELNYSSDIDLLFLYDGEARPDSRNISNREYFIRQAQLTAELLSRPTPEGAVFRIDLRLRPQGNEGELAVPLGYAIHYYSQIAHDWELQAMIKARHSAGDFGLARAFTSAIQPYVYQPKLNFAAIKTALSSLEKIGVRRRLGMLKQGSQRSVDVKLDRGGIRDIEFLVQCLQRVYGGAEGWLHSPGTLFALQKLHDKEHLSSQDVQRLTGAYQFLRTVEHRLQLRRGQQLHRLPASHKELEIMARSVSRAGNGTTSAERFLREINTLMADVAEIYDRVVYREQSHSLQPAQEFQLLPGIEYTRELVQPVLAAARGRRTTVAKHRNPRQSFPARTAQPGPLPGRGGYNFGTL